MAKTRGALPVFATMAALYLVLVIWSILMAIVLALDFMVLVLISIATYHFFSIKSSYRSAILKKEGSEPKFWLFLAIALAIISFTFLMHPGFGVFCAIFLPLMMLRGDEEGTETIRGQKLDNLADVIRHAKASIIRGLGTVYLGGVEWAQNVLGRNVAIFGQIGTGKTTIYRHLLQDIVPTITPENGKIVIIADFKQEAGSIVEGFRQKGLLKEDVPIHYTQAFDSRCVAPNFSSFIIDESDAMEFSKMIIPENPESKDPFWDNNARNRIALAVEYFQLNSADWYLHDVISTVNKPALQKRMLSEDPYLQEKYGNVLSDDEEMEAKHLGTLATYLPQWQAVAGLWQRAKVKIDIDEVCQNGGCILVLGYDAKATETVNKINYMMLNRIGANILNSPNLEGELRTFLLLDEFGNLGKLQMAEQLFTSARSKLASIIIGLQSYTQLIQTYGENVANTISGMCAVKVILRVADERTAKWASNLFGSTEDIDTIVTPTIGDDGRKSRAINRSFNVRQVVLPNQFQTLPSIKNDGMMSGYYIVNGKRYEAHQPASEVFAGLVSKAQPEADYNFPDIRKLTDKETRRRQRYLKPWTDEDLTRLNIAHLLVEQQQATIEPPPSLGGADLEAIDFDFNNLLNNASRLNELRNSPNKDEVSEDDLK